ncbi:MAG: helix-turn-helix transcriptional regulator [Nitrospirota bacterium]|nr:helix-turn-helix transcriptional regulator [Nitrospirota bacterium]
MERDLNKIIGSNLLSILKKKKLTQIAFAKKIKKSPVYVNNVIKGRGKPSLDAIAKICEVLEIQPKELFIKEGDVERNMNILRTEYAGTHIQMASIAEELVDILLKKKVITSNDLSAFAREIISRRKTIKTKLENNFS